MAYTPINWQTGDTITAEKLNRCDNGWSVSTTELFSETVTTVLDPEYGDANGALVYSGAEAPESMVVTVDSVDYVCERQNITSGYAYGAPFGDYTELPFTLFCSGGTWGIYTQTAGEHTVSASVVSADVSSEFAEAVSIAMPAPPVFSIDLSSTTWQEVYDAVSAGRLAAIVEDSGTGADVKVILYVGESDGTYEAAAVAVFGGAVEAVYYNADSSDGTLYPA